MKKKLLISFVWLIGIITIQAQEKGHYYYINGGTGFHNLLYNLENGTQEGKAGYTFNVGYNYFFSNNWGIGTGIGIRNFTSTSTLNYIASHPSVDTDGESYEFRTYYKGWKEQQKLTSLDIPLGISYQAKIYGRWKMTASAGGKISFPVTDKYHTEGGEIETRGYYSKYNVELYGMKQHGFSTYTSFPNGNMNTKAFYSAFIDFGGLYVLTKNLDLYIGFYFDYGINNAIDAKNNELYQQNGTYNGLFSSNQLNKVSPVSYGIKLGLNWYPISKKPSKRNTIFDIIPESKK